MLQSQFLNSSQVPSSAQPDRISRNSDEMVSRIPWSYDLNRLICQVVFKFDSLVAVIFTLAANVFGELQWNLDLTKSLGNGKFVR